MKTSIKKLRSKLAEVTLLIIGAYSIFLAINFITYAVPAILSARASLLMLGQ